MPAECPACLDTFYLMADERAGHCPLCMTVDRMKQAVWEGSQAEREMTAEVSRLEKEVANLTTHRDKIREYVEDLEGQLHAREETERTDALNHLRAYFVSVGLAADPVTITDPNLEALYEALT